MARTSVAKYPWGRDAPQTRWKEQLEKLPKLEVELREAVGAAVGAALDSIGIAAGELKIEGGALGRIVETARRAAEADGYQRYEAELLLARRMAGWAKRAQALGLDLDLLDLNDRRVRSKFDEFVAAVMDLATVPVESDQSPGNVPREGGAVADSKSLSAEPGAREQIREGARREEDAAPTNPGEVVAGVTTGTVGADRDRAAGRAWPADLPEDPATYGPYQMLRGDSPKMGVYAVTAYIKDCPHPWRRKSVVMPPEQAAIIEGQRRMIMEVYGGNLPDGWKLLSGFVLRDGLMVEGPADG